MRKTTDPDYVSNTQVIQTLRARLKTLWKSYRKNKIENSRVGCSWCYKEAKRIRKTIQLLGSKNGESKNDFIVRRIRNRIDHLQPVGLAGELQKIINET